MKKQFVIAPSILAFDQQQMLSLIKTFYSHHYNHFHYDIMDGQYVSNVAFSKLEYLKDLLEQNCSINIHLMVNDPAVWINNLIQYKVHAISFPFEIVDQQECLSLLKTIQNNNIKAGIAIHPSFDLNHYKHLLQYVDYITFMSVIPGKCGQSFLVDTYSKLHDLIKFKSLHQLNFKIELDGGVNFEVIKKTFNQIDYYVSGSFIMNYADHLDDFTKQIAQIRK